MLSSLKGDANRIHLVGPLGVSNASQESEQCLAACDFLQMPVHFIISLLPGTTGKAPSPPPLLTDRQVNEKVENLSIQLRLMTRERNELRKRLAFATHGTTFDKR